MKDNRPHFLIIAGEASGDLHGSNLVSALKALLPHARFSGMGGSRMQEAGVDTLFGIERMGTVGIVEVLGDFGHYYGVYRTLMKEIASCRYDAIILIDYPTLNLRLAKQGRRFDCPVFFSSARRFGHGERAGSRGSGNQCERCLSFFRLRKSCIWMPGWMQNFWDIRL